MNKSVPFIFYTLLFLAISSCSGSETYRGKWFAVDDKGNKHELFFTQDKMTLQRSESDSSVWSYSQNSVSLENGSSKYGIKADNGLSYSLFFPTSNKEKGAILDANGNVIYIIGRSEFYSYQDVFGLN